MRLTPNQSCYLCGEPAEFGCDSWDDQKKDYCDRPVCPVHARRLERCGMHFCARHLTEPAPLPAPPRPFEIPSLFSD